MDSPMESSSRDAQKVDVLIGGAGFAGLALAIALRQGLAPSFSVAVADPALGGPAKDGRASAIVAAARRLFETIGVWQEVEAQPILDMVVTDSRLADVVRPAFLSFDGDVEPGEPFAHMIENGPLLAALAAKAKAEGVALRPAAVTEIEFPTDRTTDRATNRAHVRLSNGEVLAARLLVAADGARSAIRERAGIASHGWSYGQSAIVTTVAHERDHHGRAEEHFLPAGPFAILPLTRDAAVGHRSSIVWTEEAQASARAASSRSAFRWRARSSPIASRSWAMPPTSSIRLPGRGSIWGSRTSPRSPQ